MDLPQDNPVQDPNAPITPEQRAELGGLLEAVKQGMGKWNSVKFSSENQAESAKRDELKNIFQMLLSRGINLQDPQAIGAFLSEIRQNSPEIYPAVEKALDSLLGTNYETTDESAQELGVEPQGAQEAAPPQGALQGVPENI